MPTCQNCNKQWSWKQTLKSGFVLDTGMKCPFCQSKQYPTAETRKRTFLLTVIILLPMLLPLFNISPMISLILMFLLGVSVILVSPFYTQVCNDEPTL